MSQANGPDVERFYDDLAATYHLVYADWRASVVRQGALLADLIRAQVPDARTVLDCTCGIGTQAIGLALAGFDVTGTDISAAAVTRARHEADSFDVDVRFAVADVRELSEVIDATFDVVISGDNSLPHLLDDADLLRALRQMRERLVPAGLAVIGIRDYDALAASRPRFTPPNVIERDGERSVLFQLWDWSEDGQHYDVTMFVHRPIDGTWATETHAVRYRALLRADLERVALAAGLTNLAWHPPDATGHHQPLLLALAHRDTDRG